MGQEVVLGEHAAGNLKGTGIVNTLLKFEGIACALVTNYLEGFY